MGFGLFQAFCARPLIVRQKIVSKRTVPNKFTEVVDNSVEKADRRLRD
jgi:hypothetical protein